MRKRGTELVIIVTPHCVFEKPVRHYLYKKPVTNKKFHYYIGLKHIHVILDLRTKK